MRIIGIDLGIKKVALAVWEGERLRYTDTFESREIHRHDQLRDVADFVYESVQQAKPDYVFIEDILIGNNRKYSIKLAETMGATLADLALCQHEYWFGIYTVNVGTWKKQVIGDGKASKDTIKNYMRDTHGAYYELCGGDQDRFDAACIGYYGVGVAKRAGVVHIDS